MNCIHCNTQNSETAKFCRGCGKPIEPSTAEQSSQTAVTYQTEPTIEVNELTLTNAQKLLMDIKARRKLSNRVGRWFILIWAVLFIPVMYTIILSCYKDSVKKSVIPEFQNVLTINSAFNRYFTNGSWSSSGRDGSIYITFKGTDPDGDNVELVFKVRGISKNFELSSCEINGKSTTKTQHYETLQAVYDKFEADYNAYNKLIDVLGGGY